MYFIKCQVETVKNSFTGEGVKIHIYTGGWLWASSCPVAQSSYKKYGMSKAFIAKQVKEDITEVMMKVEFDNKGIAKPVVKNGKVSLFPVDQMVEENFDAHEIQIYKRREIKQSKDEKKIEIIQTFYLYDHLSKDYCFTIETEEKDTEVYGWCIQEVECNSIEEFIGNLALNSGYSTNELCIKGSIKPITGR